jgi:benzoylformate decarboxylase
MTGSDALLQALSEQGVTVIFGNPGSTELPLMDALAAPGQPRFILGLTEATVMGMADGYAQSSGQLGVALVHVQPGMANAMSGVLNAARSRVPLLVIVGQQLSAMLPGAPFLGGEIVAMAAPIAAHAEEVHDPADLGNALSRAVAAALGPPMGPAVLSIPLESQAGASPALAVPPGAGRALSAPDPAALDAAAGLLARATNPIILAGDGVTHAGACDALSAFASRIGAPVMGEPFGAMVPMATDDPMWAGTVPRFAAGIRGTLEPYDVVLALGMPVFRLFGWSPGSPLPDGVRLIHADVDPREIGRTYAPEVGMVADPLAVLEALGARLPANPSRHGAVAQRVARARSAEAAAYIARADAAGDAITGARLSQAIASGVQADDLVVDEGLTSTRDLRTALGSRRPGSCLWHRGSALGWGLPAAVGASIADPSRRVVCIQGDGSLMFGVHALWTAASEGSRLALVVGDNSGYEILRAGMEGLTGVPDGGWPGLALDSPRIDVAEICHGFGASTTRVDDPADLDEAMHDLIQRSDAGPAVLVAGVSGRTPPVGGPLDDALQ